jgi:hypothetical protein
MVNYEELHGEALSTPDGNGLVVDDGQQVLVGSDGDQLSIEGYRFDLVAREIQHLDLSLIRNRNKTPRGRNRRDIPPSLLPLIPLPFLIKKPNPKTILIGINQIVLIKITGQDLSVDEKKF